MMLNKLFCHSSDEKLECFSISLAPVRAEIDLQNRHYWDTLTSSLQTTIITETVAVDKFISDSTDALSKQPRTVDEIGEAKSVYTDIIEKSSKVRGRKGVVVDVKLLDAHVILDFIDDGQFGRTATKK